MPLPPNDYYEASDQPGKVCEDKPAGMSLLCWGILSLPKFFIGLQLRQHEYLCHVLRKVGQENIPSFRLQY